MKILTMKKFNNIQNILLIFKINLKLKTTLLVNDCSNEFAKILTEEIKLTIKVSKKIPQMRYY